MTVLTRTERLALLLHLLGDEAMQVAKEGIDGTKREELEMALSDFRSYPPNREEIDFVLDDFETYFSLAMSAYESNIENEDDPESDGEQPQDSEDAPVLRIAEEQFDVELEPEKRFEPPKLTGEISIDLNRAHPYQVAFALKDESPQIIALVVQNLAFEHSAETIGFLPTALRPLVFLELSKPADIKPLVEEHVLRKTLEMALAVEQREEEIESSERMAEIMRSLPQSIRGPMLEELAKSDKKLAAEVKDKLYRFEDLERLAPRDLQKLLGQIAANTLALALKDSSETLITSVLDNMSKRAKQTLQEEMDLLPNVKSEELDEARTEVVKLMVGLIDQGEISLE